MHHFEEYTCTTSFVGRDFGFVARHIKLRLELSSDSIEFSFNGTDIQGKLGPTGTLPIEIDLDVEGQSQVFLKSGAGGEKVAVYAND